ncbi:ATP-grasp domain-containing protein [Nocardioides speluncae]|uniref:ATP-grasp domain-containing protein n=1 Tax=Nocardioides speluncae TaxID=2670337 RepID=UPI00137AF60B|nr:hypothetical protein [Nocardioides speluncae]
MPSDSKNVLLVSSREWAAGEPGHEALDAELAGRGIDARWVCWDDPAVDWADAALVAVRATWDYTERPIDFLEWARDVGAVTRLLNGVDVFAWNHDKAYLTRLGELPAVPTRVVDGDVAEAIAEFGTTVLKPRVGAGGDGLVIADRPDDPRLADLPATPLIAQPLVESIRTEGEVSVFVLGGEVVAQIRKVPGGAEIRAHEHRGARCFAEPLGEENRALALRAFEAAAAFTGRPLDYARIDMLRLDDGWTVGEIEAIEPGLYLDVLPDNARPFADLVAKSLSAL